VCLVMQCAVCLDMQCAVCLVMQCAVCLDTQCAVCLDMQCAVCLHMQCAVCLNMQCAVCLDMQCASTCSGHAVDMPPIYQHPHHCTKLLHSPASKSTICRASASLTWSSGWKPSKARCSPTQANTVAFSSPPLGTSGCVVLGMRCPSSCMACSACTTCTQKNVSHTNQSYTQGTARKIIKEVVRRQPALLPASNKPLAEIVGLARTIYIRCVYGIFGREFTTYTVIYGVYIRLWPTLRNSNRTRLLEMV